MAPETGAKVTSGIDQMNLALERTFLAHERTLMAWVRTAASLITFGFTLFKFFEYLHEQQPGRVEQRLFGARNYGTVMIVIGVLTLALATLQHRRSMNRLRAEYPAPFSLALLLAALISLLGILALVGTFYRG